MEDGLSRVIKLETAGKERTSLVRGVVLALRTLAQQTEVDNTTRDLAAFVALALPEISATVEVSVVAWEKRGYWVKADRFRLEWEWAQTLGEKMRQAVLAEDWPQVAVTSAKVAQKVSGVDIPARHRLGTPWIGAWERLRKSA